MRRISILGATLSAFCLSSLQLGAQTSPAESVFLLNHETAVSPLRNGLAIEDGTMREEIVALRDDVLRIRIGHKGAMPEDASWAVLPGPRASRVAVTEEAYGSATGFRTKLLHVQVSQDDMTLSIVDNTGRVIQRDASPVRFQGTAFRIAKAMPIDEHYFGLGDKSGPLDRREQAFSLWNTDAYRFQESTDPLYKSIPFFLTYRAGVAAGVLLDNTWRTSFDFGREQPSVYSFGAVNGPLDYYVIYGPTPRQVVESYAWLTGKPPLPPMWTLGFQQSRYSYTPQSRVLEVASRLRADHIPADAIYLDIGFQEKNRPFTVDTGLFPDFKGMIKQLRAENFHVVAITDLHIANLPNQHYAPFDSGMAGDHFVKNPDGSVFTGIVWPGPSVFPDFTRQQTRAWWGSLYSDFHADGIDGFWNDMNEPSVFNTPNKTMPLNVVHRIDDPEFVTRTATHAEVHNVYGMENSRATYEGLRTIDPNLRPFVLTRATYAGGQRYAATWTGDNSSSWNHLRMTTSMLENLGLSGFAFAGADVGGYAGTPTSDLLTKWIEIASFQPIDRDHTEAGTGDQEPWAGGPQQESIRRRFIETRYRLMPYLYTIAEESARTGLPLERPLFLDYPDAAADHRPLDIDTPASGEFLLGHDLLIAAPPFPEELDSYEAEFPTSDWYDFWTGGKVQSPVRDSSYVPPVNAAPAAPLTAVLKPEPDALPVFVRGGAILPMAPLVSSTNESPQGPLTLRVYSGDDCRGSVYWDDGRTYAYQQGDSLRVNFTCHMEDGSLVVRVSPREGPYAPWWKTLRFEIYGWKAKPAAMDIDGKEKDPKAEALAHGFAVSVPDNAHGMELRFR